MSRSKNTIRFSDFSKTPIKLTYKAAYTSASLNSKGITIWSGINGPVNTSGSLEKTTINYITTRHLYYSNYLTGSNLTTTSSYDNFLQSSAASGSGDWDNRYFPTESNSQIKVISIPRQIYGERISRNGFAMSSSTYQIFDDGNGNVLSTIPKGSQSSSNAAYTANGVKLYLPGYATDGTGTNIKWSTSSDGGTYSGSFWANPLNNTSDGRLNSTGLWSASSTSSLATGVLTFNVSSSVNTTYYFGMGCDNVASLYLDNSLIVAQSYPEATSGNNFNYWHIYPVTITSGSHVVKFIGTNTGSFSAGNPGSMGIEVYNNTQTQISSSITSQSTGSQVPASLSVLYSSKDHLTEGVFSDTNNVHIGNIIYAQGIVIVTNQDYLSIFDLIPTTTTTTTTSTTSTTTTAVPTTTTSTTTTSTTIAPTTTTSTTSTTTTAVPTTTTSTTSTTTTAVPTTSTTSTTTTIAPTTSTTTTTTTRPVTTTSTTTTTTTAIAYYYYTADQYLNCFYNGSSKIIRSTDPSLTFNFTCGNDGYQYLLTGTASGPSYDTDQIGPMRALCTDLSC